jgi:hypothetical protein
LEEIVADLTRRERRDAPPPPPPPSTPSVVGRDYDALRWPGPTATATATTAARSAAPPAPPAGLVSPRLAIEQLALGQVPRLGSGFIGAAGHRATTAPPPASVCGGGDCE